MDHLAIPYTESAWLACFTSMEEILGHALSDQQKLDLQRYSALLLATNQRFNLIGPSAVDNLLTRHLLDALPLLQFFPKKARVADIGSGGGLPGIVLAILCQPTQWIHLIESIQKKASFLQQVISELALRNRAAVSAQRAEQLGLAEKRSYDLVVSRALGSLHYGAELAAPLLRSGGAYLALKGRNHAEEFSAWRQAAISRLFHDPVVHPLDQQGDGVIVRLVKKAIH
ncbi:16S rRNA (guanine(527)-N(7))-methyltransferase RsmG [Candidatus Magnetaquicoccus inordinatus]|uniref:16S rRNA (guanine(527)-N(7))-methyltransferase RsmG n=1 Tax=Candidatus Magnetaquicoccus inordinatus TaxID=2496818 RepID=UPI00187D5B80|nr:16S rRNA (guanine(527)-N(7))-methyltransferase RsmG [Candidatus Magnetaquicoccus inordinatus]